PDDLIAHIHRLDEQSDGFGGLLIQATEWGTREQVLHSYELIARHVKPHFQGSLVNLQGSQAWSSSKRDVIMASRTQAIEKAKKAYFEPTPRA
ncbi:LLM class flavin-dependent oxidoreductase, partial [Candidatus Entotheonella serta]